MARYQNLYDEAAKKYGLSPDTLRTFARIESGHNPNDNCKYDDHVDWQLIEKLIDSFSVHLVASCARKRLMLK